MQYWQHHTVANGIQELVDVPRGCERCRFRFPVPDDRGNNQVRVIESSARGVGEHVAKFTAFVDRARLFRCAVASNASGKGELLEKRPQAFFVLTLVGIYLRIRALQINRTEDAGSTVSWSGKIDHVQVVFLDESIQVYVDKGQSRAGSVMPEKSVFDVFHPQGFSEKGIVLQVDHAQRQVNARAPKGVGLAQFVSAKRFP